jgi:hypothetical protein
VTSTTTRGTRHAHIAGVLLLLLAILGTGVSPALADDHPDPCDTPPLTRTFSDVDGNVPLGKAVLCVAGYGVVSGSDGAYRPNDPVTRGEAAGILADLVELSDGAQLPDGTNPFADVERSGVFGARIIRLARSGIVQGTSPGTYAPADTLTRGQMTAIVARSLHQLGVPLEAGGIDFEDVHADGPFHTPIAELVHAGIAKGMGDGTFQPGRDIKRVEIAALVTRAMNHAARHGRFLPTAGPLTEDSWRTITSTLQHARVSIGGPRVVNLLRWRLDDPGVSLVAEHANASGARPGGLNTTASVLDAGRADGVVAAVNGGFWGGYRLGDDNVGRWDWRWGTETNGLFIRPLTNEARHNQPGRMVSDPGVWRWTSNGSQTFPADQYRSAFGLFPGGGHIVGKVTWQTEAIIGGQVIRISGVNREPWITDDLSSSRDKGAIFVNSGAYVSRVTEPGRYLILGTGLPDLQANGEHHLTVVGYHQGTGPVSLSSGQTLLFVPEVLLKDNNPLAAAVGNATEATIRVTMDPAWERTRTALAGGPLLVNGGTVTDSTQWTREAFTTSHTDSRHPRTAIGFTEDGMGYIVTIDGRRAGASIGMTVGQTGHFLRSLGVIDAVMMDGGGSTQMVVNRHIANRPCCDSSLRRVDTVLQFERTG